MFRHVSECSGMFHVPGFIDARFTKELLVYGTKKSSSEFIIVARNKYFSINGGSVDLV